MATTNSKPRIKVIEKRRRGFWSTVQEMLGRIEPTKVIPGLAKIYPSAPSIDYSKGDYGLFRAIFYASENKSNEGVSTGDRFLLGAVFGKPIVNSAASFTIGALPTVILKDAKGNDMPANDDSARETNNFLNTNKSKVFKWVRNGFRDGDSYVRLKKTGEVVIVSPMNVTKLLDPVTADVLGYDIENNVEERDANGNVKKIKYVEQLRKVSPFRHVTKTVDGGNEETVGTDEIGDGERPLPIVHFANEQDDGMSYGVSDYQSSLYLMANYHAVLSQGIKNNMYNGGAVPIFEGIEEMEEFMAANFEKDEDGNYVIQWDSDKLFIVGKGGKASILSSPDSTAGMERILKILFYLIVQTSETPEFVMGTAVQSSKASVSEQVPVMVAKAQRKQGQLEEPLAELIKLFLWNKKINLADNKIVDPNGVSVEIDWQPIVSDDLKVNVDVVKTLSDLNAIRKETAIMLLNPGNRIKNPADEVKLALEESKAEPGAVQINDNLTAAERAAQEAAAAADNQQ